MARSTTLVCVSLAALLCIASGALAQTQTGEIFGRVTDRTGAVLPGATVTIDGPALIRPQAATAATSGAYRFPNLAVGTYRVTFELGGFKRLVMEDVRVQAGFNAQINGALELSTVEETVTVSGQSPLVDLKSSTLGTNFGKELLDAIPSAFAIRHQQSGRVRFDSKLPRGVWDVLRQWNPLQPRVASARL